MRVNTTHHVRQCFCDFYHVHLVVLNDIENQSTKYYYAGNVECKSLITLTKKYRQPLLRFLTAANEEKSTKAESVWEFSSHTYFDFAWRRATSAQRKLDPITAVFFSYEDDIVVEVVFPLARCPRSHLIIELDTAAK